MSSKLLGEGDDGVEKLSQISLASLAEDLGALKRVGFFEAAQTLAVTSSNPSRIQLFGGTHAQIRPGQRAATKRGATQKQAEATTETI